MNQQPRKPQAAPLSIRLYRPIKAALMRVAGDNVNYCVNSILAEKLGIHPDVVEACRRDKREEEEEI